MIITIIIIMLQYNLELFVILYSMKTGDVPQ